MILVNSLERGTACFSHKIFILCSFVCACAWAEICQGKAQQKKKKIVSKTNERDQFSLLKE